MKILHLASSMRGGAGIAASRLVNALIERGIDVKLLYADKFNIVRLAIEKIFYLFHEKSKEDRFQFSTGMIGENIVRKKAFKEADIIHLHWINNGFISIKGLQKIINSGKRIIWTFHDAWAFTGGCHYPLWCTKYTTSCGFCHYLNLDKMKRRDLSYRVFRKKAKIDYSKVTVIAPSQWMASCAAKSYLFKNKNIHRISNVLPPPRKHKENRYILFVACNVHNKIKGFDYFISAMKQIDASIPIMIAGKSYGGETNLFNQEVILKRPEDIMEVYTEAYMTVVPSLQENLGNVVLESMLCGTPVVAFNVGGMPEIIEHKKNGYLAKYQSSDDLAAGVQWILDHKLNVKLKIPNTAVEEHIKLYENNN